MRILMGFKYTTEDRNVCVCARVCMCVCVHARISREQGTQRERQPACPGQQVYMRLQHESDREETNES